MTHSLSEAPPRTEEQPPSKPRARTLKYYLEATALPALLLVAVIFFAVWPRTGEIFTSPANLRILISSQVVVAIVALAALVPLICYEFDLSVGAVAGLSSMYCASALATGTPLLLAIGIALGVGLLVGIINALIITKLGVNSVITTLAVSFIIAGIVDQKTGGLAITGSLPRGFATFGSTTWFGVPKVGVVLVLVALVVYYVLAHTPYGRYLYAQGSNQEAARLSGIPTGLTLGLTFVAAAVIAAVAGILQVSVSGAAVPSVGPAFTLPALAAAFLSAAAIKPGTYNVGGTLVAIFFLAVLNNGLDLAGAPTYVANYVNGAALVLGVALSVRLGGKRRS